MSDSSAQLLAYAIESLRDAIFDGCFLIALAILISSIFRITWKP